MRSGIAFDAWWVDPELAAKDRRGAAQRLLMGAYLIRRLLLVIPTLFGIIAINFAVVQFAPGGPVEQMIAELKGQGGSATERMSGAGAETMSAGPAGESASIAARAGSTRTLVADIRKMFGFDKPPLTRFWLMLGAI